MEGQKLLTSECVHICRTTCKKEKQYVQDCLYLEPTKLQIATTVTHLSVEIEEPEVLCVREAVEKCFEVLHEAHGDEQHHLLRCWVADRGADGRVSHLVVNAKDSPRHSVVQPLLEGEEALALCRGCV